VKHPIVRLFPSSAWLLAALTLSVWLPSPALGQEYTIGPRDVLAITVWGQADLSRDYTVDPDGFIPFPLIGRVKAVGSNPKELAAQLTELLAKDYLVNPQVIVSVKEYLSQKVQVLGAAEKPGVYYLTGPTSVLEILSKAGGLASTAGKQVILLRNLPAAAGGTASADPVRRLSLEKIQAGDPAENTRVQNQDTIIVSKALTNSYFVFGEVKKPGGYALDKETNILEGITIAGGFTDKASPSRTRVIRSTPQGQKVIEVDMNDILRRGREAKAVMLQESDVVVVPESFF
jgi:polysaccharide export outer membrane protein